MANTCVSGMFERINIDVIYYSLTVNRIRIQKTNF